MLKIDVVSDVVCPWCYLGKRRLERAFELAPDIPLAVRWRPFQLDPTVPPEGIDRRAYLEKKFGSVEAVVPRYQRITEMGAEENITYRFDRIKRSPNTIDAHRLIHWAASEGQEDAMVERLFRAYFSDGLNLGDHSVLAKIAGEIGLDEKTIAARLATDEDRETVESEIAEAYRIGVTGVPCFIVGERYAVMGAQAPETLAQAIHAVLEERTATSG